MKKVLLLCCLFALCLSSCSFSQTESTLYTNNSDDVQNTETSETVPPDELTQAAESTPVMINRPYPQHTSYSEGTILPNHRTQDQLDEDVCAFYDYWKNTYVVHAGLDESGSDLYRIAFSKNPEAYGNTVSEGQGFGMIILPVMAGYDPEARNIFDGLWRFAKAHPSEVDARLMDWNLLEEEGNDSAFDGDADIALGLLMADAQWGSGGVINYKAEAENVITGILESTIGPQSRLPMLGDWIDPQGEDYNQYMPRSSDFMLVNFRAYGKATGDPVWEDVVDNSLTVMNNLQQNYSPVSGLIPDFIVMAGDEHQAEPAPAFFLEGEDDGHYYYNAGRVPWRVGSDALLNGDERSKGIAQKISVWAEGTARGNPMAFHSGYDLEGNPLPGSEYFTTFFVAPLGVAAMTNSTQQQWLNNIYDAVYTEHEDYYEDTVNLLCLIVMSGNAWAP